MKVFLGGSPTQNITKPWWWNCYLRCGASEALNRIRKAVEHRRQERVQKRRLQPVTNPEAAAISKRAKNRRRAEGC